MKLNIKANKWTIIGIIIFSALIIGFITTNLWGFVLITLIGTLLFIVLKPIFKKR